MANISTSSKVAYMYDQATDTWYPITGITDASASYSWSGTHNFASATTFDAVVKAKAGVNNFQNPTERDSVITSPTNGIVVFVRQDDSGNTINQVQYYFNGSWRYVNDSTLFVAKTASYALGPEDVGRTVIINAATSTTITIPLNSTTPFVIGQRLEIVRAGAGDVDISGESGSVIINSKNGNTKIAAQYSGAVLIKTDTNTWLLIGDLTA